MPPRPVSASVIRAFSPIVRPRIGAVIVVAHKDGTLGEYEFDGLGFSLKKVVKNVVRAEVKAVKDVGHAAGKAVTSTAGKAIIAGGLALTGVGLPAAAAIGAGTQGVGTLIKPHGNVRKAAKAGATGAAGGVAAGLVGKVLKNNAPNVVDAARGKLGMKSFRPTAKTSVLPPVRPLGVPSGTPLVFKKVPDLIHGGSSSGGVDPVDVGMQAPPFVKSTAPVKLLDAFKRKASAVKDAVTHAASGPVYDPGTGPMAPDAPPASASADTPKEAGILGNIPPVALIGGAAVLLVVLTQKRGR